MSVDKCISVFNSGIVLAVIRIWVSSAYACIFPISLKLAGRSLVKHMKRRGPSMEPYRTPVVRVACVDVKC